MRTLSPPALAAALALLLGLTAACSDDTTGGQDFGAPDRGTADAAPPTCGTTAYLPADSAVGDFKQSAAVKVAATGKQLQDLINGGSEKYQKNGFSCMALAVYQSASASHGVEVWLFDQGSAAGAKAAFEATKNPDDTPISPTLGDESRENKKLLAEYTADMRKGRYLARVKIDDKTGAADGPKVLKVIADALP